MRAERVSLSRGFLTRDWGLRRGLVVCLVAAAASLAGQSGTPSTPSGQQDNPFPGEPQKAQDKSGAQQPAKPATDPKASPKPDAAPAAPKKESDNPFPGEDSNAPIIPV